MKKQNQSIVDLYNRGFSWSEIGKRLDIHPDTARGFIYRSIKGNKIRARGEGVIAQENRVKNLLKEGLSPREILKMIGAEVSYSRILEIAKENNS